MESTRLVEVEKQLATQGVLIQKFDTALDKISEVSLNVSKLLAVHEQRLDANEQVAKELPILLENRRQEFNQHISDLYKRVGSVETELRKEMTNGQKEILTEIKSLRHDLTEQTDALRTELQHDFESEVEKVNTRVSKLERFIYIAIGGVSVLSFIITEAVNWVSNTHK